MKRYMVWPGWIYVHERKRFRKENQKSMDSREEMEEMGGGRGEEIETDVI
jgi:hypothetical protein